MFRPGKNSLVVLIVISRSSIITITKQGYYNRMQWNKRYPFSTPDPDLLSGKKAQTIQPVIHQNIHDPKHGPMLKSLLVAFFGVSGYHGRVWCASSPSVSLMGSFHPKALKSSSVRIVSVSKCFASILTILQAFAARSFGNPSLCRPRIQKMRTRTPPNATTNAHNDPSRAFS